MPQAVRQLRYARIRIHMVVSRGLEGTGRGEYGRKWDLTGSYGLTFDILCIL